MPGFTRLFSWTTFLILSLAANAKAEPAFEDRPEVLKATPLSGEEATRRESKILFAMGVMRHRGDRWLEAMTLLEEAAKLDPETPAADRALIPLYLSLAREDDALDACRRVLKRVPDDSDTAYQLAKLYRANNQTAEAIAALKQGVNSPRAGDRHDLQYFMLLDLAALQEKSADNEGVIDTQQRLAKHLIEHRARLIGSETLTRDEHAVATALAYEKVGHAHLKEDRYDDAIKAFQESRDYLTAQSDPETKKKAVRLNWNLAQACMVREKWSEAATFLDAYLEFRPIDPEPYEKLAFVLRKLDRERDVVSKLKMHAERSPDVLAIQLLYARELARDPGGFAQAEAVYRKLADRFVHVDIYRGLFKLYQSGDKMIAVLELFDAVLGTAISKDDIGIDVREAARNRGRLMLQVLRTETSLVNSLLPVAVQELRRPKERKIETWQFLAGLAANAKQYDKSELFFRHCLANRETLQEAEVYGGLIEVLWLQRKHDAIIILCQEALYGMRKAEEANRLMFHRGLALAYSEKEKIDEAIEEADKAIKLAGAGNKVQERCRKVRILSRVGRYPAAIQECETLLKEVIQADEIKLVRYTLSSVYHLKGDHEKSEEQLKNILADDPNDPGANNDLGYQWADRNLNLDEAEKMIRKAIEVDHIQRRQVSHEEEDNAAYLDSLGWVLFRKGKVEEARDWLEKASALSHGTEDPTVWDHLGDVYLKLGQKDKAKDSFKTAIKLYEHDFRTKKEGRQDEARKKLKVIE
ncbi:MAG: tetratricopeptide repeat protein [Planctomycetes bacterium]|nr:tetratricopeptide repeat protein [Planctomycetota bacterium]